MKKIIALLLLLSLFAAHPAHATGGISGRGVTVNPLAASTLFLCLNDNIGTGDDQQCTGTQLETLLWNNAALTGSTSISAGGDKQILLKDHGILYSSSGLTFNSATGALSASTLSAPGTGSLNLNAGSLGTLNFQVNGTAYGVLGQTRFTVAPAASSVASTRRFSFTAAADTGLTAGAESTEVIFDLSATRQHALNTAIAANRWFRIASGTDSFAGGVGNGTITNDATLSIDGGPSGGTNAKITNSHALFISTIAYSSVTNGYGMTVNASTGATNNYAAEFLGGNVGIKTSAPVATLDVAGAIKMADGTLSCAHSNETGTIRYNSSTFLLQSCHNGSGWTNISPPQLPTVSSRFYTTLLAGGTSTGTNTTPLADGTEYAVYAYAPTASAIKTVSFKTGGTNASSGASIKACIYAADGTNGTPGTLLSSTAAGTAVTDSAVSTSVKITMDAVTNVPAGPFWIALLQTSTTGVRMTESTGIVSYTILNGSTSNDHVFAGDNVIYGYTVAQAYASGCASPFGTAVANTNVALNPVLVWEIN